MFKSFGFFFIFILLRLKLFSLENEEFFGICDKNWEPLLVGVFSDNSNIIIITITQNIYRRKLG